MKRIFTSIVFGVMLAGASSQALAAYNPTRHSQPRPSRRFVKADTIANYRTRYDRRFARQRYSMLVQRIVRAFPSRLTVTGGGRTHPDNMKINRPTARSVSDWALKGHCSLRSVRCE